MPNSIYSNHLFPFSLDPFQLESIDAINQGHSLVVNAPTGSGKTLVAEYAIHRALKHNQRVFYTTPLKALSNQKLRDFSNQFGIEKVGLLTGDVTFNRNAQILVMTTEIFRNMLYSVERDNNPVDEVETVILDECHYMNDVQRGTVWEESIINCPLNIQLIALSATIANAGQLADWIDQVHGPTTLIMSDYRPVVLNFSFCNKKGLHPLTKNLNTIANVELHSKKFDRERHNKSKHNKQRLRSIEVPQISFVLFQMAAYQMLPAIYFIFSRRNCDKAVKELGKITLVTKHEQNQIKGYLDLYRKNNPESYCNLHYVDALTRGIAAHHAGILPTWKELIEKLFQKGLIKVVFATETLAAGINMPARSTVISSLSKRTDQGHRYLHSNEFLQMAGRAGRRGLDRQGYVIIVQNYSEGIHEANLFVSRKSEPLISQFTPNYSMVTNLLERHNLNKAKELIERSFGHYLFNLAFNNKRIAIEKLKDRLENIKKSSIGLSLKDLENYYKLSNHILEEKRIFSVLSQGVNNLEVVIPYIKQGTIVSIKSTHLQNQQVYAVVVKIINRQNQNPLILFLTCNNLWILLPYDAVIQLHTNISYLDLKTITAPQLHYSGELLIGNVISVGLALSIAHLVQFHGLLNKTHNIRNEITMKERLIKRQEQQLEKHPLHNLEFRMQYEKCRDEIKALQTAITYHQTNLRDQGNDYWDTFLHIIEILQHFGGLYNLKSTEIGQAITGIRGDNELWLSLVLMSGHLDDLSPQDLAAISEAITTEVNRPDISSIFRASSTANKAFQDLGDIHYELLRAQQHARVSIPIWWEPELMGLVQAWCNGANWNDLISGTSLDEGDVVRILRRTLEFLSQIPNCLIISEKLRTKARVALSMINRFPISESEILLNTR